VHDFRDLAIPIIRRDLLNLARCCGAAKRREDVG
jgi:hypothetical protein